MFGIQKKGKAQQPQDAKGGKIKGKGTGTSDDIKKNVESGSYIMPADSTQKIGEDNLDKMGSSPRVNLSNGEYQLTPNEVHSVGVSTLERMKDQTHTPVNQPQLGIKSGKKEPELFFANGGVVSPYPSADDIRKATAQKQMGGPTMRDVGGVTRDVNRPLPQTYQAPSTPAANPASTAPAQGGGGGATANGGGFLSRAGSKAAGAAKGLGVLHGIGSMIGGAVEGFNTPTEDYATRMGLDPNADRGLAANLGIRAAGVMSDVGNTATFGILGNRFPDKQRAAAEQGLAEQQARFAAHNASKSAQPVTPAAPTPPKQPSFNDTINNELYGTPPTGQPTPKQDADPYAIQQKGNSFSYANPNAANQARAAGVPELQSSGFAGGIRPANDPRGVQNLMQNTREFGPTDQQVNQALNQLNGQQGQGITYPDRPARNDMQEAERNNVLSQIQAPIKGARGMTSSQRSQLIEMQTGEDNRATTMYNTDANNATSQLNNSTNNAASIAQTMMREQGSNDRAVLGENGQNSRYGMGLEQDAAKFNAEFGLKNREAKLNETKEGFGIRNSQRVEKLYEMYDKAETDEQRASIQEKINRFTGAKGESGKDRYMTVGGGQEYNKEEGVMINRPQQIFDTQTSRMLNMDGTPVGGQGRTVSNSQFDSSSFKNGQVYQDKNTGQYFRWDEKSQRQVPVQQ